MLNSTLVLGLAVSLQAGAAPVVQLESGPATVLRLARSSDGLTFEPGPLFAEAATAPSLCAQGDGSVVAMFDRGGRSSARELALSRSRDGGRSWSLPRALVLDGRASDVFRPLHGCAVEIEPGILRAFFVMNDNTASVTRGRSFVASGLSRDGRLFSLDRNVEIRVDGIEDAQPVAARIGPHLHLFIAGQPADAQRGVPRHYVTLSGSHLRPASPFADAPSPGCVVPVDRGMYRMYVNSDEGIGSLISPDGERWRREEGVRMPGARDAGVARLPDGEYLMLYVTTRRSQSAVAAAGSAGGTGGAAGVPAGAMEVMEYPLVGGGGAEGGSGVQAGDEDESAEVFAPRPDWSNPVDYCAWINEQQGTVLEGNAFDAYAEMMTQPGDAPGSKDWWPDEIDDIFNGDYKEPPIPWDPAQYPNLEATHQQMQDLLGWYRDISRLDAYRMPIEFTPQQYESAPDGRPALFELLLPSLAQHRAMTKATLADAWRAEGGYVPPERMLDALETSLRGSNHMLQGPTVIHHLVGTAEQALVRQNAFDALKLGVFSGDQLASTLDVLRAHDLPAANPVQPLRFEHAASMDFVQHAFRPGADGQLRVDPEFLSKIATMSGDEQQEALAAFSKLGPEDAVKTVEAMESCYREMIALWKTGYPQARSADLGRVSETYAKTNQLTRMFIPALSRAFEITARSDATRKGLQLTYAAHLFQSRNGRWPVSLDELPAEYQDLRRDPFTGGDFGYQLTPAGPKIYSRSENGVDDGGVHSPRWSDAESVKNAGGSDDYVFWPPQPR